MGPMCRHWIYVNFNCSVETVAGLKPFAAHTDIDEWQS